MTPISRHTNRNVNKKHKQTKDKFKSVGLPLYSMILEKARGRALTIKFKPMRLLETEKVYYLLFNYFRGDVFTAEMHEVVDEAIFEVNKALIIKQLDPLPLHLYTYYNDTKS